jgi:Cu(I)/Ag(I) efflux system membrane protein CusA/SilA
LIDELDKAVRLPGWTAAWTAPARARMDMMATGVRTPIGIRIVSPDPQRLDIVGTALRALVERIPGTRSAVFESLGGESWIDFNADEEAMQRLHVLPSDAAPVIDLLTTGGAIGEIEHEGRPLRVRVAPDIPDVSARGAADILRDATVRSDLEATSSVRPPSQPVPLALLGTPAYVRRPAALRTEKGELCAYIYVDLADGTDIQGYVDRARREVDGAISTGKLPLHGERIEWTGQYDLMVSGQRRLFWIVPIVALSMLGLLFLQFRSLTEALLVLISVPFALVGSFWTLYLLGYPMSAPVWVGLLSVVGLAMQTGVVMVVYIDEAFHRRVRAGKIRSRDDIVEAHAEGTVRRLRPKIMTITTMMAALLPLLWAEGAGAEIMRRVAAPMIGGLATSAFLTLEVLPVLYTIWRTSQLHRAQRLGVPVKAIVGEAPSWAQR